MPSELKSAVRMFIRRGRYTLPLLMLLAFAFGCKDLDKSDFLDANIPDGEVSWVVHIGGPGQDFVRGIDSHSGGDIVVVGQAGHGEVDYWVGQSGADDTAVVDSMFTVFTARYSPAGSLVWVETCEGENDDHGRDIVAGPDGSSLITGTFAKWLILDPGSPNPTTLGDDNINTSYKGFVANYASDGNLHWAKQIHGVSAGTQYGLGVATSAVVENQTHWSTGNFKGEAIFGLDETEETTLVADSGVTTMFIAAYGEDGSLKLARQSEGEASGETVVALGDGTAIVVGSFEELATFSETTLNAVGSTDAFLARYAENGDLVWAMSAGGEYPDEGRAATELTDGTLLVAGQFEGSLTLGSGEPNETTLSSSGQKDVFFAKYAVADGALIWARSIGGSKLDDVGDVAALSQGGFIVVGSFAGSALFGELFGTDFTLSSAGDTDIFVAGFDALGNLTFARREGGGGEDFGYAVVVPGDDSVVVAGKIEGEATIGTGDSGEATLTTQGDDGVIFRLDF